nr:putative ribonuclease H-like domain-containing protein [Tanacetum cinerariifolium]
CDLHEQRFAKTNAEGKRILGRRPAGKPGNLNRPKPVSAGQQKLVSAGHQNPVSADQPNPVSAGEPNPVSAGDGILGPRPLNIQPMEFYGSKGIRRDYSNARTPQQNRVVERKNRTLIEAARTMLADSLLPTIFSSEAVATTCYVLNREDDSDSNDEPDVLIIHSTPTLVVLVVDEATTQNDGTKSDHATTNADNLEELTVLQALQRQEQAGKREADQLGLAFPSLNP